MNSLNQKLAHPILEEKGISLIVKREDLIHPQISGNKYRKLKYNLIACKKQGYQTVLTFGGAYSNHIAATAYAGKIHGLKTIGVIRGEELQETWLENPTLAKAHENGMQLYFVTRNQYRLKQTAEFLSDLKSKLGKFYILPEGGTNALAVQGCEEIITQEDHDFDFVCTCVGTGGTLAGLSNSVARHQKVLGFPALKGDFLKGVIRKFAQRENWELISDYHFGGYAKIDKTLVDFINNFKESTNIALDPVYTGKLFFGLFDMIKNDYFQYGTKILAIHTGGLQGVVGMNLMLKKKNLPLLNV